MVSISRQTTYSTLVIFSLHIEKATAAQQCGVWWFLINRVLVIVSGPDFYPTFHFHWAMEPFYFCMCGSFSCKILLRFNLFLLVLIIWSANTCDKGMWEGLVKVVRSLLVQRRWFGFLMIYKYILYFEKMVPIIELHFKFFTWLEFQVGFCW